MTDFLPHPEARGLMKLKGKIENLQKTRDTASFVFTKSDQTKMGVVAIAAALADMGGQAMSAASNASAMEELADYLEFTLNGQAVKGWVWRSPFNEGDEVEVAAEWQGNHYEAFGIARPSDKTIALYPHCSRGRLSHIKNVLKWWLWLGFFGAFILMASILLSIEGLSAFHDNDLYLTSGTMSVFFAVMFISLSYKWMPFVRLAEKVFKILELRHPGSIDLVKSSKAQRTENDPGEFGTFYFRY